MKMPALIVLIIAALLQLAVPLRMALRAETALSDGTPVKFPLVLRDPYDPMRGKYVRLNYNWPELSAPEGPNVPKSRSYEVCALVEIDAEGIATITGVSMEPPPEGLWFRIRVRTWGGDTVHLQPNFDRYFVNEYEAYEAEIQFRDAARRAADAEENETGEVPAYAVIRLWDGEAQLEDVMVDGRSLAAVAREALGR